MGWVWGLDFGLGCGWGWGLGWCCAWGEIGKLGLGLVLGLGRDW